MAKSLIYVCIALSLIAISLAALDRYASQKSGKGFASPEQLKSLEEVRRSAEQGNIFAQNSLARYYETGNGVPMDRSEAVRWHLKVADHEPAEAARWDQLVADSENTLALDYLYGSGVVADPEKAAYWKARAKAHGYIPPPPRPPGF
jgi:TPR repeat protein